MAAYTAAWGKMTEASAASCGVSARLMAIDRGRQTPAWWVAESRSPVGACWPEQSLARGRTLPQSNGLAQVWVKQPPATADGPSEVFHFSALDVRRSGIGRLNFLYVSRAQAQYALGVLHGGAKSVENHRDWTAREKRQD